ncbi:MAG TPA: tetratricopeptide repeat protein [Tepidisphaeraceae bacterium]|jgi:hypothetical protein|nr:tetratricopeptide repeat protein [Tepidisphaeraceae bacterium]
MKRRGVISLVLVIVTVATFGRIVTHEFTGWDDAMTIFENQKIVSPSLENVGYYWSHSEGGLYIPVTYTLWSAIAAVSRVDDGTGHVALNPWAFHAISLLIHVFSVLVVFQILRLLIDHDIAAMIGALLFAVHPLQVETVAWTSGAKDLLGGLFSLVCIWQYVLFARSSTGFQPVHSASKKDMHGLKTRATSQKQAQRYLAFAAIALVIAMLAKPSAVTAPLIGGAIDLLLIRRSRDRVLLSVIPLLLLAIPFVIIARNVQTAPHVTNAPDWTRPLVALDALAFYVFKLIWPRALGIIYGRTPDAILKSGQIFYTWIAPVLLFAIGFAWRRKWPALLCSEAIAAFALLPVLGLTPFMFQVHSTTADHYMYVAMLGVALLAASIVARVPKPTTYAIAAVALLACAVRSTIQAGTWKDSITLATHAVEVNPASATAHSNLGIALAASGQIDKALPQLEAAVEMDAENHNARSALAQAYLELGRPEEALQQAIVAINLIQTHPLNPDERADRAIKIYRRARAQLLQKPGTTPSSQP